MSRYIVTRIVLPMLLAITAYAQPPAVSVPPDFRVTLHYVAGNILEMSGDIRDVTITSDGTVARQVTDMRTQRVRTTKRRLSLAQLTEIFAAVQQHRFFSLPARFKSDVFDCPPLIASVTAAGRSHRVIFPPCLRSERSARQFQQLFDTIVRIATPRDFKRSNQAMQLTAPRSVSPLWVATTFNLQRRALPGAVADLVSR